MIAGAERERMHDSEVGLATSPLAQRLVRHRRLVAEEAVVADALAERQADLERLMRAAWLACVQGDVSGEPARRRCDAVQEDVARLERELCRVRASLAGSAEDLARTVRAAAS